MPLQEPASAVDINENGRGLCSLKFKLNHILRRTYSDLFSIFLYCSAFIPSFDALLKQEKVLASFESAMMVATARRKLLVMFGAIILAGTMALL